MYLLEEVVLPPGEKIRRIRGYLGLKQYEITGNKITRNLISYIENEKTKLVKHTAEIIVDSMNKWAEKKKIPLNIDAEYLMRDEITQAKILLDKYIINLKKYLNDKNEKLEDELNKAKDILKDWDVTEKKAEIYEIAGDYHYKREQFNESYINYLKALESYIEISNHLKSALLYSKLARCVIWLKNYQEAINLNNYALLILEDYNICDKSIVKRALLNNALAYKKLKLYDECLFRLEKLESIMADNLTELEYMDVLMLKGNCYFGKENYSIAEKIYKRLIDIVDKGSNLEIEPIAYKNLGDIYFKNNKIEKSIEYINKSIEIRLKNNNFCNNSFYLANTYLDLGKRNNNIGNYDFSKKSLLKALEESKKKNDLLLQIYIYKELLNCYINCNEDSSIDNLIGEVKKIIIENSQINQMKDIFFQAGYHYIEKDIEKCKDLLKFGIEIINK